MARHCPVARRATHLGFTRRVRALRGQVTDSGLILCGICTEKINLKLKQDEIMTDQIFGGAI